MERGPSLQSITWFLDLDRTKRLDLDPSYQRRSVWTLKDRQYFLDTIFRHYPCPAIFIHPETNDEGITTYHVVDGKQRLQTIFMFASNKIRIGKNFGDQNFDAKMFNELVTEQKRKFWDYVIAVDFVKSKDSLSINEIFDRLNRNSKNLNEQELRHAKYAGWFITEVEKETQNQFWESVKISTKAKSKRMKDNQFVSELLMVILEKKLVGFDQNHINDIYAEYDDLSDNPEFEEDAYVSEKEKARKYVEAMENSDCHVITKWAKTVNNFYTLWSVIVLWGGILPPAKELAAKYDLFMTQVDAMRDDVDPQNLSEQENRVYNYYSNSRGANTDLKQRNERFSSLKNTLLK